jgi:hypothetical protein
MKSNRYKRKEKFFEVPQTNYTFAALLINKSLFSQLNPAG